MSLFLWSPVTCPLAFQHTRVPHRTLSSKYTIWKDIVESTQRVFLVFYMSHHPAKFSSVVITHRRTHLYHACTHTCQLTRIQQYTLTLPQRHLKRKRVKEIQEFREDTMEKGAAMGSCELDGPLSSKSSALPPHSLAAGRFHIEHMGVF